MAAGLVNNTIRQLMADTRSFYESGGWCDLGHVPTYVSATSFTIPTDVTAYYTVNRRIRFYGTIMGTFYGYVVSSAYSSPNTTVTVILDSGALTSNLSRVDLSFLEENATLSKDYITNVLGITSGYANMFRNPFMEVAQRGTSGTITAGTGAYTLDGWAVTASGGSVSWQQAGSVLSGSTYSTTSLGLLGSSGLTACGMYQRIESNMAGQISGRRVTVQFVISNQTGASITPTIATYYPTAIDNHTSVVSDLGVTSLQTIASGATATVSYTFNTNFLASRGYGFDLNFGSQLNGAGKNVYISAADIRVTPDVAVGLNNAPPRPEYRPRGPETILCQRYYWHFGNSILIQGYGQGSGTNTYQTITFPTFMRVTPVLSTTFVGGINVQSQSAIGLWAGGFQIRITSAASGDYASTLSAAAATSEF
jgi:hypothetical protein